MNTVLGKRLMKAHPAAPWAAPDPDQCSPHRTEALGILWRDEGEGWVPDLDDDATRGVLLATARLCWDAERLSVHWYEGDDSVFTEPGWIVDLGDGENVICGATDYAEALVIAIEEAPTDRS